MVGLGWKWDVMRTSYHKMILVFLMKMPLFLAYDQNVQVVMQWMIRDEEGRMHLKM